MTVRLVERIPASYADVSDFKKFFDEDERNKISKVWEPREEAPPNLRDNVREFFVPRPLRWGSGQTVTPLAPASNSMTAGNADAQMRTMI